jgi:hypothetical protein
MIRASDYKIAEEIRENLGIQAVKKGEEMPFVPKSYINYSRLLLAEFIIFFAGIAIFQKLEDKYNLDNSVGGGFAAFILLAITVTIFGYAITTMKKWFKGESLDKK